MSLGGYSDSVVWCGEEKGSNGLVAGPYHMAGPIVIGVVAFKRYKRINGESWE